jgi:serine protease inhibitor
VPDLVSPAASNTAFALDLYHALTGSDPTPNVAFAPYSLSVALTMAYGNRTAKTVVTG